MIMIDRCGYVHYKYQKRSYIICESSSCIMSAHPFRKANCRRVMIINLYLRRFVILFWRFGVVVFLKYQWQKMEKNLKHLIWRRMKCDHLELDSNINLWNLTRLFKDLWLMSRYFKCCFFKFLSRWEYQTTFLVTFSFGTLNICNVYRYLNVIQSRYQTRKLI